ncbi:MAG: argininosuccinate lyase [bacterium]|nr:argininosuccinate lyase [bacterium]
MSGHSNDDRPNGESGNGKPAAANDGAGGAQMWGGRFQGGLAPEFEEFQKSLTVDHALAMADLETNLAWSEALLSAGVFDDAEQERIADAIRDLAREWSTRGLDINDPAEDIHSLVERELVTRCGDLGKRIHTGRSRNDQVATDLRLYLREKALEIVLAVQELCATLVDQAATHTDSPIPGYTHLQRAQPLTIGHHALAYAEALSRDRERLIDVIARIDRCPLGCAALAGTTLAIDREELAAQLDFSGGAMRNSLDAISTRDHLCELLFACSMTLTNLSRLAEDYIFFASHEAGFVRFGDAVSTGSSLMPQKRNPDAMELVRGKAGQVQGALMALLTTIKGLPMAYNRDLQTDKEVALPALQTTIDCLTITTIALRDATFDRARCREEAGRGYLEATDLADLLVDRGVPFRDAHELVGRAVDRALELGIELRDLPDTDWQELLPGLPPAAREQLSVDAILARRGALGGTAPTAVAQEVRHWREQLRGWHDELIHTDEEGADATGADA